MSSHSCSVAFAPQTLTADALKRAGKDVRELLQLRDHGLWRAAHVIGARGDRGGQLFERSGRHERGFLVTRARKLRRERKRQPIERLRLVRLFRSEWRDVIVRHLMLRCP